MQQADTQSEAQSGPLLLSVSQAARELGRTRKFIYRLIRTGELRSKRISDAANSHHYIPRPALLAYLESTDDGGDA